MSSSASSSSEDEQDTTTNNQDIMMAAATTSTADSNPLPSRVIITVGTYDGVVAGWELLSNQQQQQQDDTTSTRKLKITFASPVHGGSVRSLCLACAPPSGKRQNINNTPGSLLSTGYDEMLKTHDYHRRLTSSGEVRTPADFGTPICSSFAPPAPTPSLHLDAQQSASAAVVSSTHCIVGFSSGKLVIYKKRDWTIQHVLAGHTAGSGGGGIASLAVHPTGKLALTGGAADGKLKLWDLTKGRLSFVTKVNSRRIDPIVDLVWSQDGTMYGYCHGCHITVRDVATGNDWCDVELPSRVNQIALLQGQEGIFVAAACNDGSLPVLAVKLQQNNEEQDDEERRAVMAIEPVEGPVAGEERYKCIETITGYYVATANSAGVISLMNLQGAINMIMTPTPTSTTNDGGKDDGSNPAGDSSGDDDDESSDNNMNDDEDEEEEEMAVDIIDAVRLGSGARVTCLVTWASTTSVETSDDDDEDDNKSDEENREKKRTASKEEEEEGDSRGKGRKQHGNNNRHHQLEMDPKEVEKARELVAKAKKMQKKKKKDSNSNDNDSSSSSNNKRKDSQSSSDKKDKKKKKKKRQRVNPPGE